MEDKRLYLTFIQNVIARMNSNAFDIKKWTIAIITACMGAYATTKEDNPYLLIIGIFVSIGFWIMDAYYLRMECQYRKLFDEVIKNKTIDEDKMFNMNASKYVTGNCTWRSAMMAKVVWPIYALPIVMMVGIFLVNYWGNIEVIYGQLEDLVCLEIIF